MSSFRYLSGHEIRTGDRIRFHGKPGQVEFVITEAVGDPAMDWYLKEFPGGGFMLRAEGFGHVFLDEEGIDEKLEFVEIGE